MSICSASLLESIAIAVPIIVLNFFKEEEPIPFVSSRVAMGIKRIDEIPLAIEKLLHDDVQLHEMKKAQEKFLYEYIYTPDGQSSRRGETIIEKIATLKSE